MIKFALAALLLPSLLYAQNPVAITDKASNQMVEAWMAKDSVNEITCVYAHYEDSYILIDSIGPLVSKKEAFCNAAQGIARYTTMVDVDKQRDVPAMMWVLSQKPNWLIVTEIYTLLKGNFGNLHVVPRSISAYRPKSDENGAN